LSIIYSIFANKKNVMRILISWISKKDLDFDNNLDNSPNISLHKISKTDYDKHILLSTLKENIDDIENIKAQKLRTYLTKEIRTCKFEIKFLNMSNAYDLNEVLQNTESVIEEFRNEEIEILFTSGTSIMSIAFYLLYIHKGYKIKMIQGIEPKFSDSKRAEFKKVELEQLSPGIIKAKTKSLEDKKEDYFFTKSLKKVYERAKRIAKTPNATALIQGESGTGKEHLAKHIHNNSDRKNKDFIAVNCASLSDDLLESRLFGYVKGAFTGADEKGSIGFFEKANKGTIFLDEIGDISPSMQQSLLRVLEEGKIVKVGDTKEKNIDVRIIAATNKDLFDEVENEKFRKDLYYRINKIDLFLPSLKDRGTKEIKEMIEYFNDQHSKRYNKSLKLSKEVKEFLYSYNYPGNVRELESIIESFYILYENNDVISIEDIPEYANKTSKKDLIKMEDVKREHIKKIYKRYDEIKQKAADALDISVNTLKVYLSKNN
ncbi:MAG: sigma 54-interacting transcriptional regulator, partial [Bacteroidota bacterium]|nr:sigma 54-interacting transcriptional regulator [Bacteroidota bacterium]